MTTARVAQIEATGGPEVIGWVDVELPPPGPGEVRMRNTAVGLNFIDVYFRRGLYPMPLPAGLGSEAAGVVEAVGDGVGDVAVGDRVGTFGPTRGAYATMRNLPAAELVPLPDGVDDASAAAILLKGCTAEFLVERCARVSAGQTILVHAAAGGVGQLLVGWLKAIGALVIGTVGHRDKAEQASAAGADHVIVSGSAEVAAEIRRLTDGRGVDVAFDGVGRDSWPVSLAAVRSRGLIVSYGNASGPVDGVALATLAANGSLFVTRPTLFDYYREPGERAAGTARMFAMLEEGAIRSSIGQRFALADAAEAHRQLEAAMTRGATILLP